jgi:predicted HTH transcriptional regulator
MSRATDLLTEATELTKLAEELEAQLQEKIDAFNADIAADKAKVAEAKREAAAKIQAASRAMATAAPAPSAQQTRTRGSLSPDDALAFIRDNPGTNAKQIADETGVSAATGRKVVDALIEDGQVRKEGERRGTKLYAA